MARPSLFNEALAHDICERIADAESLRSICRDEDYPDRRTVNRWLADPAHVEFRRQYALAREASADSDDDDIRDITKRVEDGDLDPLKARVIIDAKKWSAGKRKPKVYGDSTQLKHSGAIGSFDASRYSDEQLAALASVLGDATPGAGDAEGGEGGDSEAEG